MEREKEILALLDRRGAMPQEELIRLLEKRAGTEGMSGPEIERAVAGLIAKTLITRITGRDWNAGGIRNEENTAVFLATPHAIAGKRRFDRMIDGIPSGSREDIMAALHEALLYKKRYRLGPDQLDIIVQVLNRDGKAAYLALRILSGAAAGKGDFPSDIAAFRANLRAVVERFRDDPANRPAVMQAVYLLAGMEDPAVVGQLEHDAARFDGEGVRREEYMCPAMVTFINTYAAELDRMERYFSGCGHETAARDIRTIREYGRHPGDFQGTENARQEREVEVF